MIDGQWHNVLNEEIREITGAHTKLRKEELDDPYICTGKECALKMYPLSGEGAGERREMEQGREA